jgi:hypothetical protein
MRRTNISKDALTEVLLSAGNLIRFHYKKKGEGAAISTHEVYGLLAEEMDELMEAMRDDDASHFYDELMDIAVAALHGAVSLRSGQGVEGLRPSRAKTGELCPYCKNAKLAEIKGDPPYTVDHLQCPRCDSTFNKESEEERVHFTKIPGPEDCAKMTLGDFMSSVDNGGFVDDDGIGYLATEEEMSSIPAVPSKMSRKNKVVQVPKWATHVVWFNK